MREAVDLGVAICLSCTLTVMAPLPVMAAQSVTATADTTVYRCKVTHGRSIGAGITATVDVRADGTRVKEEQILGFGRGTPGNMTGSLSMEFRSNLIGNIGTDNALTIRFGSKDISDPVSGQYMVLRLLDVEGRQVDLLSSRIAKNKQFIFAAPKLLEVSGGSGQRLTEARLYESDGTLRTTFLTAPLDVGGLKRALAFIEPVKNAVDHIVATSIAAGSLAENCSPIDSKTGYYRHGYWCRASLLDGKDKIRVDESSGMLDRALGNHVRFTAEFIHRDPEQFLDTSLLAIAHFGELRIMGQYNGPDRGIMDRSERSDHKQYYPPIVAMEFTSPERTYREWGQNNVNFRGGLASTSIWDVHYGPPDVTRYIPTKIAAYRPSGQWLAQEEIDWASIEATQKRLLRDVLAREKQPVGACEFSKTLMNNPDEIVVIN
ncbi:hypothetical protein [Sphingopyxis kveilinensis]|uniref:hypothetical protein n=1 Tax=Sphingopyxis kveilinensis TaxID=3114367 RepID=UPI0030CE3865